MADNITDGSQTNTPQQPKMQILGQFIRDMSFENVAAQKGIEGNVKPDIQVKVNLDARKRTAEGTFEIVIKMNIESKAENSSDVLFIMELEYAGIFQIENVAEDQLHPFLMIECPRMIFPFLRRIVSDITRDGGYPALNLDNIDFLTLYRQELERRATAEKQGQPIS